MRRIRTPTAVLVAISIPIFTTQLEKSREATDAANLRAAYAEVMTCALTGETDNANGVVVTKAGDGTIVVTSSAVSCKQTQTGWQSANIKTGEIGGVKVEGNIAASTLKGWVITYKEADGSLEFKEQN